MKKELKAVCGTMLAVAAVISAGRAGAEVSIGMEPIAYSVKPAVWGQVSRPSADRLSKAAESLAEASGSGDTAKAETLLAGLFSGAVKKEATEPVYAGNKQAAPAPSASVPVKRAARARPVPVEVTEAEWVLIAQEADATEEEPAVKDEAAKEEDAKDEASKPEASAAEVADYAADFGSVNGEEARPEQSLGETLLGGGIGMLLVILLILL